MISLLILSTLMCISYVQGCENLNLCCESGEGEDRWKCKNQCSCIFVPNTSATTDIHLDIPYGVKNVIVNGSAVRVTLYVEREEQLSMCGQGVTKIILGRRDPVFCVSTTTVQASQEPSAPEKHEHSSAVTQDASTAEVDEPTTVVSHEPSSPAKQGSIPTTQRLEAVTRMYETDEPRRLTAFDSTGQEPSTTTTASIVSTATLPASQPSSVTINTSMIIIAIIIGIVIIAVIIFLALRRRQNRQRSYDFEMTPTSTLSPFASPSSRTTHPSDTTMDTLISSSPSSPAIVIHTPPPTSSSASSEASGNQRIQIQPRSPIITRSVTRRRLDL